MCPNSHLMRLSGLLRGGLGFRGLGNTSGHSYFNGQVPRPPLGSTIDMAITFYSYFSRIGQEYARYRFLPPGFDGTPLSMDLGSGRAVDLSFKYIKGRRLRKSLPPNGINRAVQRPPTGLVKVAVTAIAMRCQLWNPAVVWEPAH